MPELVSVRFRDCSCPGTPHPDGDVAQLRPYLNYEGGAAVSAAINRVGPDLSRFPEVVGPVYLRVGIAAWNLLDEQGQPVPVTPEAIEELPWEDAYPLGEKCDDLYADHVLIPFQPPTKKSSKAGRTNGSTRPPSSAKPRTRSARSSSPSSASAQNPT